MARHRGDRILERLSSVRLQDVWSMRTDGTPQMLEDGGIHAQSRELEAFGSQHGHGCFKRCLTIEACVKHSDMLIDTGVIQFADEINREQFGSSSLIRRDDMKDPQR